MKIEITESEICCLNFFYGFLEAHKENIKIEKASDLEMTVKQALANQLVHLESLLEKINVKF